MTMTRRDTLALAAAAALPGGAAAQPAAPSGTGSFTLPPLPWPEGALAPVIDAETIGLHHGKHHAGYVKSLNEAVAARPELAGLSVEAIMGRVSGLPAAVRNPAGQHYAHSLYWEVMAPPGQGGAPSPALAAALDRELGGLAGMKAAFEKAGAGQFGSGWAWLLLGLDGKLAVTATGNANTPLMDDAPVRGYPLLVNDVWEHAYYLTYRNRRAEYLGRWWEVVNWNRVNGLYDAALRRDG
jgi:Fe-Mn family superoxide dismutase